MDNQAKIKELEKELAAAIQIIKHLEKCGLSAKSSDKIKEMEQELAAAKQKILNLEADWRTGEKNMKAWEELEQEIEIANSILKPLMKTVMEKHLCSACLEPMEPVIKLDRYDKVQCDKEGKPIAHEWKCKCSPNIRTCVG